jgi:Tir chaperone protein (CesT) family
MASELLQSLLAECGLADKAVPVDERFVRLQYGSAFVLLGISGSAVVAVSPLFRQLPAQRTEEFYRKLLYNNAQMGGMASFAIQDDGWVVLHAGRSIKGLDAHELAVLVGAVGRFADQYDDQLIAEFYASPRATSMPVWDEPELGEAPPMEPGAAPAAGAPVGEPV